MQIRTPFMRVILLLLLLVYPPVEGAGQSTSMTRTEITPNPVGRGDRFGVTITVGAESPDNISVEAPNLPDGVVLLRGPNIRPIWITDTLGQSDKRVEISYLYRSDVTGKLEIGPYRITNFNRVFSTEPQLLEVGVYRNRQLIIPLEVVWDVRPERVYVGQNVLCVLKSLDERDIRMYDEPSVTPPAEGFFQSAEGVGDIRRYTRAGVPLYELPLAGYIFTPSFPGEIVIPRARLTWENGEAVSDQVTLEVRALPEQVQESGAVGSFRVLSTIEKSELAIGERLELAVRVEGTGNLNFLQFPAVEAEGFTILGENETTDYSATPGGYMGVREYTYTFLAEEAGEKTVGIAEFSAVLPRNDQVYTLPASSYRVRIINPEETGEAGSGESEFPFPPVEPGELSRVNLSSRFLSWDEYIWLLPGPLLFILFLVFMRRKLLLPILLILLLSFAAIEIGPERLKDRVTAAAEAYSTGDFAEAEYLYEELAEELPEFTDLYYNAALSAYRQGRTGEAVLYTRTALVIQPLKTEYREFLNYMAGQEEINTTIDLPFAFHPDFFLFIITLTINLAAFVGIFMLFYRKNAYFIGAVLLMVMSIIAGVGMTVSLIETSKETAVVFSADDSGTGVRKIPRAGSERAFTLREGETVHIRGRAEGFFFLNTSLGQKGWISEGDVKMIPDLIELAGTASERE